MHYLSAPLLSMARLMLCTLHLHESEGYARLASLACIVLGTSIDTDGGDGVGLQ